MPTVLQINASSTLDDSLSRSVADEFLAELHNHEAIEIQQRNVHDLPTIDADWIAANFTPAEQRSAAQRSRLQLSDDLLDELIAADHLLIATPMYNFSTPAGLKHWIDHIARVGRSFRYTESGPEGLLQNKAVTLVIATGGTPVASEIDFLTPYLKQVMRFIGLHQVEVIDVSAQQRPDSHSLQALAKKTALGLHPLELAS